MQIDVNLGALNYEARASAIRFRQNCGPKTQREFEQACKAVWDFLGTKDKRMAHLAEYRRRSESSADSFGLVADWFQIHIHSDA